MTQPLAEFTSHISGRNAQVMIWPDRIEWVIPGRLAITNGLLVLLACCTLGLALLAPACRPRFAARDRRMLTLRSIHSVSSHRETVHTVVTITAGTESINLRVSHGEASRIETLVRQLMLNP